MKKLIIVKPGCHEVANHLWNYISIYAYGLEIGARTVNSSFLAWHRYFNLDRKWVPSFFVRMWRIGDALYGSYVVRAQKKSTFLAVNEIVRLPPTSEKNACDTVFFIGWFFRNPAGLERYRSDIVSAFTPTVSILNKINVALAPFTGKTLIGLHVRQRPYKGFPDGDFLISPTRVRSIVDDYLKEKNISVEEVTLVIVSDNPIDPKAFAGYQSYASTDDDVTNLFLLAKCSAVIGTNSTFGNLAAWFGNVPHIVIANESIDWEYYRDAKQYFENKYATFAQ